MSAETETETHDLHASEGRLDPETGTESNASQKAKKKAWVRYRVEHRHRTTDELIRQVDTKEFQTEHEAPEELEEPVFELVTTIRTRIAETERSRGDQVAAPAMTPPTYRINIYSLALINAIQSVVQYYPSQDLTGDIIAVKWPYPVLAHHYEELREFGIGCAKEEERRELCIKKRNAKEHIDLLLKFLDDHVMVDVRAEQERNKNGFVTFAHLWVSYKPGNTIIPRVREHTDMEARVIHSVKGGTFVDPPSELQVLLWSLAYDGQWLGRVYHNITIDKYDGEMPIDKLFLAVDEDDLEGCANKEADGIIQKQLVYGQKYRFLLRKQCQHYKGKSGEFPFNEARPTPPVYVINADNLKGRQPRNGRLRQLLRLSCVG
ncbi:hypothetical protein QQX98_007330 [Neonectria punicea]|uniref:DUF7025 domain-containing protein n=1 Tax=Neonectria punicea TaxID=979145 RepID=A0ABR1GYJ7_9HYPO